MAYPRQVDTAASEGISSPSGSAFRPALTMAPTHLPVPASPSTPENEVSGFIERVIADVPLPRVHAAADPAEVADQIAREAARNAALVSASLALPPGPLGMLTVLPDLLLIWKIQRQLVAANLGTGEQQRCVRHRHCSAYAFLRDQRVVAGGDLHRPGINRGT